MGNLFIAGNAVINGAIFVDGAVEDVTEITGTPIITYDENIVEQAFGVGLNPMIFVRDKTSNSWREIHSP